MHVRRFLVAVYAGVHLSVPLMSQVSAVVAVRSVVYGLAYAVGAAGLVRSWPWARRYALGLGAAGILNCATYLAYFRDAAFWAWGPLQCAVFIALVLLLLGRRMRAHFDERSPFWRFDRFSMHLVAATVSFNVAGIGMLLWYASLEAAWTTPPLRVAALVVAVVLAVGSAAILRGRVAGVFITSVAALASVAVGAAVLARVADGSLRGTEWQKWEAVNAVAGFAPSAVAALLCFGVLAGPMVRYVRRAT